MRVLKIKVYQPEAHYRVPYSYQRRFTYPIPPFSTIKGFLCNVMGIENDWEEDFKNLKEGLSLAVFGSYGTLIKEYVWFRNFSKDSHNNRFHISINRTINGEPQHPGGQMPVKVDTLLDVKLTIYISHPDNNLLEKMKDSLENPYNRKDPLHLGRAEDWLVIEDIRFLEDKDIRLDKIMRLDLFTWIPSPESVWVYDKHFLPSYKEFYINLQGIRMKIPTYYEIIEGQRTFTKFIEVKLFEGGNFNLFKVYVDDEGIPLILTYLGENR